MLEDWLEDCEYVVPGLYYCKDYDLYVSCWTDYEGNENCMIVDEEMVDRIIHAELDEELEEDEDEEEVC